LITEKAESDPRYGKMDQVNTLGRTCLDVPHNEEVKEADYLIVIDKSRSEIVLSLLEILNKKYQTLLPNTSFDSNMVVEHKLFDYTQDPAK
jgi:hypothetical protein